MIGTWRLAELASQLDGQVEGADVAFTSVSTDTRTLAPGALYVALKGERFDAHDFVADAAAKGAVAAVVSRSLSQVALPQLSVTDTRWALGQLGALNRQRFSGRVAAVTGSSGKTTVKELIAAILRLDGEVLATRGNLNNDIGAPLTLLQLSEKERYAVIELGASAVGEIAYTVNLTRPDVAVITNASGAHLEGFGGLEKIRQAKGEILSGLGAEGIAVLNADDPALAQWQASLNGKALLTFGLDHEADFTARNIQDLQGHTEFELCSPQGEIKARINLSGRHNVANALAAAAAAYALGLSLDMIVLGLEAMQPVKGRLNRLQTCQGGLLLDDTYNANPASVKAALEVLAGAPAPRLAVLGDMAELGEDSAQMHQEVGAYARKLGIEKLLACGRFANATAQGFGSEATAYAAQEELIAQAQGLVAPQMSVLVKGSRSARMERVVDALAAQRDKA